MFSGIVEKVVEVIDIEQRGTNSIFSFQNPYAGELYIDQSISHNGVCLTVIDFNEEYYKVEAIQETLKKSNLGELAKGSKVNLERCITASTRMDGHVVQGHVDCTQAILDIKELDGSWEYDIEISEADQLLVIPQGSITLNGISLTIAKVSTNKITVAIIPYTHENTNLSNSSIGDKLNIEFDVFGKYVVNYLQKTKN